MGTRIVLISMFALISFKALHSQTKLDTTYYLYPIAWVSNSENEICESANGIRILDMNIEETLKKDSVSYLKFLSFQGYYSRIKNLESSLSILPLLSCDRDFYSLKVYLISNVDKKASLINEYYGDLDQLELSFEHIRDFKMSFANFEYINNLLKKYENDQELIKSTSPPVSKVKNLKDYSVKKFHNNVFKMLSEYFKYNDFKALKILINEIGIDDYDKIRDKKKRKSIKRINKCYPNVVRLLNVLEKYDGYKIKGNVSKFKTKKLTDTLEHFSEMDFIPTKEEAKNIFFSAEYEDFMESLIEKVNINIGCQETFELASKLQEDGYFLKSRALYQKLLKIDQNFVSTNGYSECSELKRKAAQALNELDQRERGIHISRLNNADTLLKQNQYDQARLVVDSIKAFNSFSRYPDKLLGLINNKENEYLNKIVEIVNNTFSTTNIEVSEIATNYLKELDENENIIVRIYSDPDMTKGLLLENKYGKGQYISRLDNIVTDRVANFLIDIYEISKDNKERIELHYSGGSDNLGFIGGRFVPQEQKYKRLNTKVCECSTYKSEEKNYYSFQKLLKGKAGTRKYSDKKRKLKFENNLALAFLRCYRRNDLLQQKIKSIVPSNFYKISYCSSVASQESADKRYSNLTIIIPKSFYSDIIKLSESNGN